MGSTDFSNAKDVIVVNARLQLLSTEEGGRQFAILTGYRPNHAFEERGTASFRTYIGEIQFDDQEAIRPGEERNVIVYFLRTGDITNLLTPGRKWWIYEGQRLVGQGEIISL